MKKLIIIILVLTLLFCFAACNGTQSTGGIVIDKFQGEACMFRAGQLTIAKPTQTGYVLVTEEGEYAVSEEQYYTVNIGDWIEL